MIFETRFDIDECRRRLTEGIDPERISLFSRSGYAGSRPFIGTIKAYQFHFKKRKNYQNGYDPYFFGTLKPVATGSIVEGRFGMRPATRIFMTVWYSLAIVIGSIMLIASISAIATGYPSVKGNPWLGVIIPIALPTLAFAMMKLGQRLSRSEMREMIEFIKRTLEAKEQQ